MIPRLFLAAAMLLAIQGAVVVLHNWGVPANPAPIEMKVEDLPLAFGDWKGKPVELDPWTFSHEGAVMAVDRMYTDNRGRAVSLHCAVWNMGLGRQGLPHAPTECYSTSGWTCDQAKAVPLDQSGSRDSMATLMPVEKNGQKACVLYWYQIEGRTLNTSDQVRQIVRGLRGKAFRPPIVKVMLHANAATPEEAEKTLTPLAGQVFAWTKGFH
jgi:EpsI family protein